MVGIVRHRVRDTDNGVTGSKTSFGSTSLSTSGRSNQVCDDVSGNPNGENPFNLKTFINNPIILTGQTTSGSLRSFVNYPCDYFLLEKGHLTIPGSVFRDATQAIAAAHPGQPGVSLPNFAYELKDVPGMLRHAADRARLLHVRWKNRTVTHRFLRSKYSRMRAGEDWLNYQFGWLPFFSDLSSILQISKFLEHRRKQYSRIRGNELRTTGSLGSASTELTTNDTFQSSVGTVLGTTHATTKIEKWWSAKYEVDPIRFGASLDGSVRNQLRDALGLDYALPIEIWDAMPYTWLADWFTNVGSIINLMGNRQGVRFKSACVMTHTRTTRVCTPTTRTAWVQCTSGGGQTLDLKNRTLFSPSFVRSDGGLNIFQPSHLATLAALKVTKGTGSSRF